ncbi:hypothetical protein [Saccharopolyspora sp. SCSIO 74807]|uniref:hypothetical protein n=1 Tax=Saccharopolyspora sp. SCSIO 74807 TaxID=3118084 RepID=UPI0030CC53A0
MRGLLCWLGTLGGTEVPGGRAELRRIQQLERECRRLLRRLDLPVPLDIGQLCTALGEDRGRRIELMPFGARPGGPVASWWRTDEMDVILYPDNTGPLHTFQCIAHELGHLIAGHSTTTSDVKPSELLHGLFPTVSPELIDRMFGRHRHQYQDDFAEYEAERVATTIRWWADVTGDQPVARLAGQHDAIARLASSFTERRGWA